MYIYIYIGQTFDDESSGTRDIDARTRRSLLLPLCAKVHAASSDQSHQYSRLRRNGWYVIYVHESCHTYERVMSHI